MIRNRLRNKSVNFIRMKVEFTTKEESNNQQEEEFLKLTPTQRFYAFLKLSYQVRKFPVSKRSPEKDNFLIHIKRT